LLALQVEECRRVATLAGEVHFERYFAMHWNSAVFTAPRTNRNPRRSLEAACGSECSTLAAMTVVEHADRWTVEIDVPGVPLEDISVTLKEGVLVVEGERKVHASENAKPVFNDRAFHKFRRELRVGEGVDQGRIDAELRDGVLSLQLFRSLEASPQKIAIRNAGA
jgi:HSP20 family protein